MNKKKARKEYTKWHWGIEPTKEVEWNDPELPDYLIETGRLVELHYEPIDGGKKKIIKLNKTDSNNSHLAFDPICTGHNS